MPMNYYRHKMTRIVRQWALPPADQHMWERVYIYAEPKEEQPEPELVVKHDTDGSVGIDGQQFSLNMSAEAYERRAADYEERAEKAVARARRWRAAAELKRERDAAEQRRKDREAVKLLEDARRALKALGDVAVNPASVVSMLAAIDAADPSRRF